MKKQIISIALFTICLQTGRGQVNGDPDLLFGSSGSVQLDVDEFDNPADVLVDSSGNTYLVGYSGYYSAGQFDYDYVILKLDVNGDPDISFGLNGLVRGDYPGFPFSTVSEAAIVSDGIVFTGNGGIYSSLDSQHVFVGKIDFNGVFDTSFGDNGFYEGTYLGPYNESRCLLAHNSKILVGGATYDTAYYHRETAYVVCLNAFGQVDSAFGGTGVILWDSQNGLHSNLLGGSARHADGTKLNDLAVTPWGEYFGCGYYDTGGIFRVFTLCFDATGGPSSTYGTSGAMIHDINPGYHQFASVTDSLNGKMVIGVEFQNYGAIVLQAIGTNSATAPAEIFPFQSNQHCVIKDVLSTPAGLFVCGYARESANSTPGYVSDYFSVGLFDENLQSGYFFGDNGLFVQDALSNDEEGAVALEHHAGRLYAAGFVNSGSPGNNSDFLIFRIIADGITGRRTNSQTLSKVYPNPANTELFVEFNTLTEGTVHIRDITGKVVSTKQRFSGSSVRLDLEGLPPGIYYVHLESGTQSEIRSFVKI